MTAFPTFEVRVSAARRAPVVPTSPPKVIAPLFAAKTRVLPEPAIVEEKLIAAPVVPVFSVQSPVRVVAGNVSDELLREIFAPKFTLDAVMLILLKRVDPPITDPKEIVVATKAAG